MVEPILYASLGALLATLIGLLFLPIFWRRAVRLTTSRLIDRLPVSASEIIASQDRLRAEQAMAMRTVERKAEAAIGEATRDRIESARARATELGHLADISDLKAKIAALESEGARVRGELDKTGKEAAAAYEALQEARAAADSAQRELQTVRQEASAARASAEQARNEASARQAEIASLRARLEAPAVAPSIEGPVETVSEIAKPAAAVAATSRLPKADFALAFPPAEAAKQQPEASLTQAAELADLRRRLDEVADAIVEAADRPAPAERPKAEPGAERPRMPQVESAGA
ncbi:hypothetical protein IHQ68_04080 [Chelatococcus sambhunathii]|uniref:Uncharacterized protein n=1 Tax=Chelatococcus sambhunathii TaxID=363953 RepID=A0ABU1DCN2_9HYPH|nr:hypothetical protein [Chelatococcus sambhunathii]MDR4305803.1 hypothetical protein [Chelatococcus sambhunathii]